MFCVPLGGAVVTHHHSMHCWWQNGNIDLLTVLYIKADFSQSGIKHSNCLPLFLSALRPCPGLTSFTWLLLQPLFQFYLFTQAWSHESYRLSSSAGTSCNLGKWSLVIWAKMCLLESGLQALIHEYVYIYLYRKVEWRKNNPKIKSHQFLKLSEEDNASKLTCQWLVFALGYVFSFLIVNIQLVTFSG